MLSNSKPGPLNYTPVPPRDPVADIITAAEDAKLSRLAKHLVAGGKEMEGAPDEPDWVGGLQPEEWLSGLKGFYTNLKEAQSKSKGTSLGEDLARGAAANTIGLLVPPLRERALKGMSPTGQVAAEVLNPTNWPLGGGELAAIVPSLARAEKVALGGPMRSSLHGAINPDIMAKATDIALTAERYARDAYRLVPVNPNSVEQAIVSAKRLPSPEKLSVILKADPNGTVEVGNLVDFVNSLSKNLDIADPVVPAEPGGPMYTFRRLDTLGKLKDRQYGSSLNRYISDKAAFPRDLSTAHHELPNRTLSDLIAASNRNVLDYVPPKAVGVAYPGWADEPFASVYVKSHQKDAATTASTLLHEGSHALHKTFQPLVDNIDFITMSVPPESRAKIILEVVTNINRMRPNAPVEWRMMGAEQFAEAIRHIVSSPETAKEMMPTFTKAIMDFSAEKKITDAFGNRRRLPFEFATSVVAVTALQKYLSRGEGEQGG